MYYSPKHDNVEHRRNRGQDMLIDDMSITPIARLAASRQLLYTTITHIIFSRYADGAEDTSPPLMKYAFIMILLTPITLSSSTI